MENRMKIKSKMPENEATIITNSTIQSSFVYKQLNEEFESLKIELSKKKVELEDLNQNLEKLLDEKKQLKVKF